MLLSNYYSFILSRKPIWLEYILTKHWESDLNFYKDELEFLNNLIAKYFIWMTKDENLIKVEKMVKSIILIDLQLKELNYSIKKHLKHIAGMIENPFTHDENIFRKEHEKLEEDFTLFIKSFREIKKEVFTITEHVIESERLQHLLTP